jgi:hypothetical protein
MRTFVENHGGNPYLLAIRPVQPTVGDACDEDQVFDI